jgi:hypothetical protein
LGFRVSLQERKPLPGYDIKEVETLLEFSTCTLFVSVRSSLF